ncbi:MAG: hypothetical protein ACLS5O_10870 [[Clostridium] leptum]
MDEKRLKAFEDMLAAIRKQYDDTTEKMAKLKVEGKEKTVTSFVMAAILYVLLPRTSNIKF